MSLSAGLLTVYTVSWTTSLFISFIAIWVLFTIFVFFISAVRLASKLESIYVDCAITLSIPEYSDKELQKKLESISNGLSETILMPKERAEIIRYFCFQKVKMVDMPVALKWVNVYYGITKIPFTDLAIFVVAVIKNTFILENGITVDAVFERIYQSMREAPVSPKEFVDAFTKTKYILARSQNTILYFDTLSNFFIKNIEYNQQNRI